MNGVMAIRTTRDPSLAQVAGLFFVVILVYSSLTGHDSASADFQTAWPSRVGLLGGMCTRCVACVCACAPCACLKCAVGGVWAIPLLPLPLQVTILRPWLLQAPSAPTAPTAPAAAPAATALPGLDSAGAGVQAAATLSLVAKF